MRSSFVLALLVSFSVGCGATARTSARVSQAHLTGDHITLDDHINFEHDSAVIVDDSNDLLDDIASVLTEHTEIGSVHIIGHTDSSGDDDHNLELSQQRAEAVAAALRARGVTQNVDARGAGETEPLCAEDTEDCHAANRRVEIIVASN
ncbi:MAG: OmpA family protein [Myxococcota bacterium]|nr:OmpA family protein [Myxococcota bacterium]